MKVCYGSSRTVVLVGNLAIKFPRWDIWRNFLWGLLNNMQETSFSKMNKPELCPVLFSLPGGFLVVMRRAVALDTQQWEGLDVDRWRKREDYTIPVEDKWDSFGFLNGRIVAVDYGGDY